MTAKPTIAQKQQTIRRKRKAAGLCVDCARPRNLYRWRCDACQADHRKTARDRGGFKPWRAGGSFVGGGRIPKAVQVAQERQEESDTEELLVDRIGGALEWDDDPY